MINSMKLHPPVIQRVIKLEYDTSSILFTTSKEVLHIKGSTHQCFRGVIKTHQKNSPHQRKLGPASCEYFLALYFEIILIIIQTKSTNYNVRSETKSVSEANRTDHVSEGNQNYYKMNTIQ